MIEIHPMDQVVVAILFASTALAGAGTFIFFRGSKRRWLGALLAIEGVTIGAVTFLLSTFIKTDNFVSLIDANMTTIVDVLLRFFLPALIGVIGVGWLAGAVYWLHRRGNTLVAYSLVLLVVPLALVALLQLVRLSDQQTQLTLSSIRAEEIRLPEGFVLETVTNAPLQSPTGLCFDKAGDLYVSQYDGKVVKLFNREGKFENKKVFVDGYSQAAALSCREEGLYVASAGTISLLKDDDGDHRADRSQTIVSNLPAYVYPLHANFQMDWGPDGRLYFGVGATSNVNTETTKYAASILSVNADGSDLQVFARNVRNPFGLAFNRYGDLFETDNGPNGLPDTPGDEFNHIVKDGDYGFPNYVPASPRSNIRDPLVSFPPHASATGLVFYTGEQFPAEYRDDAFVAFWNLGKLARVKLVRSESGEYTARWSVFAEGLLNPIALAVGPDGGLYFVDFGANGVYRIWHP